ncbi:mucoidy inhibitor MuiA family protein [Myxococcota bacterium]|nr:mucoidy inhibitor MuiA family protein [Myxococcota bacterium]
MVAVEQSWGPERRAVSIPIARVTLLEDRAEVYRTAELELAAGVERLVIADVAPVLQDASLVASVEGDGVSVADVRVRRATRIRPREKPEVIADLERQIRDKLHEAQRSVEDRLHAERRLEAVRDMIAKGVREVPEDASWGIGSHHAWRETFETLFRRARELDEQIAARQRAEQDLREEIERLALRRQAADRPDATFSAWIEVELACRAAGKVKVVVSYVVPNALWRPMHSVRLHGLERLTITSSAVVWQNTGEDWDGVELSFSTARSSLGTEPPLLSDDLLTAEKKPDTLDVSVRAVAVQRASVSAGPGGGGRPAAPSGVELPGVDDGGDILNLRARGLCTVRSDGRPNIVAIGVVDVPAECTLVTVPELEPRVFLRVVAVNEGRAPLLAGPVELVRDHGYVGLTKTMFVAPKERFELSFGPDDAITLLRHVSREEARDRRPPDEWKTVTTSVTLFVSNLSGHPKVVRVTERIPVSELREVLVTLVADRTTPGVTVSDHGICTWDIALAPNAHETVRLVWSMATAPSVKGL